MKKVILLCRQNVISSFVKGVRNQKIVFADKLSVINSGVLNECVFYTSLKADLIVRHSFLHKTKMSSGTVLGDTRQGETGV